MKRTDNEEKSERVHVELVPDDTNIKSNNHLLPAAAMYAHVHVIPCAVCFLYVLSVHNVH